MINENCYENVNEIDNKKSLVFNFPYSELPNLSPTNISQIRKCLPVLVDISRVDLFYTNLKAVKYTFEFAVSTLSNFDNVFAKDIFVELLILLKELLTRLTALNKLDADFSDITLIFNVLFYVSDLDIFCNYCSNICATILQQLLKLIKNDYTSVDKFLAGILENFKEIKADREVAAISEIILLRFPLDSKSYKLSAYWLMEDSIKTLKNLSGQYIEDEGRLRIIIRNIYTFLLKVCGSVNARVEMIKYQNFLMQFVDDLMDLSPKLIYLCCTRSVGRDARQLLGVALREFLMQQGMMSHDNELIITEEIEKFPPNVRDWPKYFSRSFFWICHLLYYYKRYVWDSGEICDAIGRLIYTKKYKRAINISVLKSVCYIYPIILQGQMKTRKRRIIGDDILNGVLPAFFPILHNVLSISRRQVFWIMYKGSKKIKIATIKFWLDKASQENLCDLKEALKAASSDNLLSAVLLDSWNSNSLIVHKTIALIQSLNSTILLQQMPVLITRFSENIELVGILIEACCQQVPQDRNVAIRIFGSIHMILKMNPNDDVLTHMCHYAANLLTSLKTDSNFVQFLCSDQFWLRYPVSRLHGNNESLDLAIMELSTKLLKYQTKPCFIAEPVFVDLAPLLTKSVEVIKKSVNFLFQVLRIKTLIVLKEESILVIFHRLYDLTEMSCLSMKVYDCLRSLLKRNRTELMNSPILSMLVEDRCHFARRKGPSVGCLNFVLCWIKLMHQNPNKHLCYLPQQAILTLFIKRSIGVEESIVNRYLHLLSEMYSRDDCDYDDETYYNYFDLP